MAFRRSETGGAGRPFAVVAPLAIAFTTALGMSILARAQEAHPPLPHRHADAQKVKSPVASTPESVAEGRRIYTRLCATCHGPKGKGDGGMAVGGGQPSDFTDTVWDHGDTEGEIFVVIRDGTSPDMEAYGEKMPETDIWHVINYIKSLGPSARKPE